MTQIKGQINIFKIVYNKCATRNVPPCRKDGVRDMCCHDCRDAKCWHRCTDDRKTCGLTDGLGYFPEQKQTDKQGGVI